MLAEEEIDVLVEMFNIGIGKSASMLNEMISSPIKLQIPEIKIIASEELESECSILGVELSIVQLDFSGKLSGASTILFPMLKVANLVASLTGEPIDSPDLDSLRVATLSEVGNILLNGIMGTLSNLLKMHFQYTPPRYFEKDVAHFCADRQAAGASYILLLKAKFDMEKLQVDGVVMVLMELSFFEKLKEAIRTMLG